MGPGHPRIWYTQPQAQNSPRHPSEQEHKCRPAFASAPWGPRQPLPLLLRKLIEAKAARPSLALDEGSEKGSSTVGVECPPTFSSCMVISLPCSLLLSMRMSRASE